MVIQSIIIRGEKRKKPFDSAYVKEWGMFHGFTSACVWSHDTRKLLRKYAGRKIKYLSKDWFSLKKVLSENEMKTAGGQHTFFVMRGALDDYAILFYNDMIKTNTPANKYRLCLRIAKHHAC